MTNTTLWTNHSHKKVYHFDLIRFVLYFLNYSLIIHLLLNNYYHFIIHNMSNLPFKIPDINEQKYHENELIGKI